MGVRAGDLGQPETARDLQREQILFLTARAVERLDRIAHLEDFELGRRSGRSGSIGSESALMNEKRGSSL